jgi:hypothetical protein
LENKSDSYMQEIVPAILSPMKGRERFDPLFVWLGRNYEATCFEDGAYVSWDKPLIKVFGQWLEYDVNNTIIIDHKGFRVGCNNPANVIITTLFYIQNLEKLEDDGSYLMASLWPLLEEFASSSSMSSLCDKYPSSFLESGVKVRDLSEGYTKSEIADCGSGEGTCGPPGLPLSMFPHLFPDDNTNCVEFLGYKIKWRSGRQGRRVSLCRLRWRSGRQGQWEWQGDKTSEGSGGRQR